MDYGRHRGRVAAHSTTPLIALDLFQTQVSQYYSHEICDKFAGYHDVASPTYVIFFRKGKAACLRCNNIDSFGKVKVYVTLGLGM